MHLITNYHYIHSIHNRYQDESVILKNILVTIDTRMQERVKHVIVYQDLRVLSP